MCIRGVERILIKGRCMEVRGLIMKMHGFFSSREVCVYNERIRTKMFDVRVRTHTSLGKNLHVGKKAQASPSDELRSCWWWGLWTHF